MHFLTFHIILPALFLTILTNARPQDSPLTEVKNPTYVAAPGTLPEPDPAANAAPPAAQSSPAYQYGVTKTIFETGPWALAPLPEYVQACCPAFAAAKNEPCEKDGATDPKLKGILDACYSSVKFSICVGKLNGDPNVTTQGPTCTPVAGAGAP